MSAQTAERRLTLSQLSAAPAKGEKLVMLTCYDASFAAISEAAGVEMLLIGDSLGMVVQGRDSTLAVSLEDTEYHVRCVARGSKRASSSPTCPSAASRNRRSRRSAARRA
jgi:3-methyl-2-oxobutanoate hydroxymethyltransferase